MGSLCNGDHPCTDNCQTKLLPYSKGYLEFMQYLTLSNYFTNCHGTSNDVLVGYLGWETLGLIKYSVPGSAACLVIVS